MTSRSVEDEHQSDRARLPRVRDRMTRRIEPAMALLRRGDLSVTEVCLAVGCQSLGTSGTRFTELVETPPAATGGRRRSPRWVCRPAWPNR